MRTPASIYGHPIHPMLVPIAIGGFVLSFAFDLVYLVTSSSPNLWSQLAYYTMVGGIVGAPIAAVPGLMDLLSLQAGPIKTTALTHMAINVTVVIIYIVNACMRHSAPHEIGVPIFLSLITIGLLLVSGWLGGKMVFEGAVGVNEPS